MPIIKFTTADVLRSKLLDKGYYSFQIMPIGAPVQNAKQDGFNFNVVHQLIDTGEGLDGKEIRHTFSNKAISMMLPMVSAARGGVKIEPSDFQLDTSELDNCKIDCEVIQDLYEGNWNNKIVNWYPYKSVVGKAPAF